MIESIFLAGVIVLAQFLESLNQEDRWILLVRIGIGLLIHWHSEWVFAGRSGSDVASTVATVGCSGMSWILMLLMDANGLSWHMLRRHGNSFVLGSSSDYWWTFIVEYPHPSMASFEIGISIEFFCLQ